MLLLLQIEVTKRMPPTSRSRISLIHLLEQVERLKLQSKRLQNSKTSFIVWIKKQWRKGVLKVIIILHIVFLSLPYSYCTNLVLDFCYMAHMDACWYNLLCNL